MRGTNGNGRSAGNVGANVKPALLTVRPARLPDLVPLSFFIDAVLRKDYFLRRGQLESMLRDRYHEILIAELDTVLVGVAITTRGTHLVNLLVHPAYRKLGIGRCLIERSEAQSVSVKLDMSSGNPRAFYEALGFESTGQRNRKGNIERMRLVARTRGGPDANGRTSTAVEQKPVDKRTPANSGSAA
jgi:ribosomal protein S18 acetylase RimI-like enzyme